MSLPDFNVRVFTINVGGVEILTMDSRTTPTPYTFVNIPSGTHNITITGFGDTGTGQRYTLTCTSSPSMATIPANGTASIKINVIGGSM